MSTSQGVWIGLFVGSTIGGLIPDLWNAGLFSFSSILCTGIGSALGIYIGFKLTQSNF